MPRSGSRSHSQGTGSETAHSLHDRSLHPLLADILPLRMQEITRIMETHLLELVQGTDATPLWYLRAGDCSPEGWLRGEPRSHMALAQCRTPS